MRPAWPVAQKGQFIPQPAWLEIQMVTRLGYRMSTDSTMAPSWSRQADLTVSPSSAVRCTIGMSSVGSRSRTRSSRTPLGRSVISSGESTSRSK